MKEGVDTLEKKLQWQCTNYSEYKKILKEIHKSHPLKLLHLQRKQAWLKTIATSLVRDLIQVHNHLHSLYFLEYILSQILDQIAKFHVAIKKNYVVCFH